jgi:formylglycine-generating enzyme required for sulfatase activity
MELKNSRKRRWERQVPNHRGNQPAAGLSWHEAAAFVNWINISSGNQAAYKLTYTSGRWSMSLWQSFDPGYNSFNQYRNSLAKYFLPSEDEWYKAAYGMSNGGGYSLYTTGSDLAPAGVAGGTLPGTTVWGGQVSPSDVMSAGGLSSYGTMAQGGNIWEMLETAKEVSNNSDVNSLRAMRGGDYSDDLVPEWQLSTTSPSWSADNKLDDTFNKGFRVAAVPEPTTYALFGIGALTLIVAYRRKVA